MQARSFWRGIEKCGRLSYQSNAPKQRNGSDTVCDMSESEDRGAGVPLNAGPLMECEEFWQNLAIQSKMNEFLEERV